MTAKRTTTRKTNTKAKATESAKPHDCLGCAVLPLDAWVARYVPQHHARSFRYEVDDRLVTAVEHVAHPSGRGYQERREAVGSLPDHLDCHKANFTVDRWDGWYVGTPAAIERMRELETTCDRMYREWRDGTDGLVEEFFAAH